MKKEYDERDATLRAAALCSASEQCLSQIGQKLAKWGQSPEAIARILTVLVKEKYIDESRFARAYALDKFRFNGWGKVKILHNLRHLGISQSDCDQGISSIPDQEYRDSLSSLLAAKSRSVKASSAYERKGKLIRFALGRGFEMDLIMSSLPIS